jgi:hypothetical protein
MSLKLSRRQIVLSTAAMATTGTAWAQARRFEPQPGTWREFEMVTRIEVRDPKGATRVWVPLPSVDTGYQQTLDWQCQRGQRRERRPLRRPHAAR